MVFNAFNGLAFSEILGIGIGGGGSGGGMGGAAFRGGGSSFNVVANEGSV